VKRTALVLSGLAVANLIVGCAFNRPHLVEESTGTNGVHLRRELIVPTWALWPATTDLAKQKVSLTKGGFSVGTEGLAEQSGGTNVVEALKSIDSILGKVRP
jgi:hypothetical protein